MISETHLGPFRRLWLEYIMVMARLDPLFVQWLSERAEVVKPVLSALVPDIAGEIARWARKEKPEIKQCWANSFECSRCIPNVEVIHGFRFINKDGPFEHAWNAYKGVHFDVTSATNNVGPHREIRVADLEADRRESQRYVKVFSFTLADYLSLADECEWPDRFVKYYVSDIESRYYRVKYLTTDQLIRWNRWAKAKGYFDGADESVLRSLPKGLRSLVVFATHYRDHVRLGVLLSQRGRAAEASAIATAHITREEYASLPHVYKPKRKFMQ